MTESEALHPSQSAREGALNAVLIDITRSGSVTQAVEVMLDGLASLTSATGLYYEHESDGEYRLVGDRGDIDIRSADHTLHDAGTVLAHRLPELMDTCAASTDAPVPLLFTGTAPTEESGIHVRPPGVFGEMFNVEAATVVPLRFAGEDVGAHVALWPVGTPALTCTSEVRTANLVANLAAPTLQRMLRIERLRHRVAESETIRRLTDSVARTPQFTGALDIICRSARLITGLDIVATAATASDQITWNAASGAVDPSFIGSRLPMPRHFLLGILHRGQEVVLNDLRDHPELEPRLIPVHTREGLRASVTVPVYVNAKLRAIVLFGSRRVRSFQRAEIRAMHAIAGTVATAIGACDARMTDGDQT